jgi:hypothetical protein
MKPRFIYIRFSMIRNPICKGMKFITAPLSIFVREDEAPLELFYIFYVEQMLRPFYLAALIRNRG